jgi:carbon dioxide concentrating mechanism protein CcmO
MQENTSHIARQIDRPTDRPIDRRTERQFDRESALGMVSTTSFASVVGAADMMLKSASVFLVGYEKTGGGHCTAIIRGNVSDVRLAVETVAEAANQFMYIVSTSVMARPYPNLDAVLPISSRLGSLVEGRHSTLSHQAIGLLETKGFPAIVGASDAMLKSAEVHLAAYVTTGGGLCTAIVRGTVANITVAMEVGMETAERIGEFHNLIIVPRPLDDLEDTLPLSNYWIEQPTAVMMPISIKQKEVELVELPELKLIRQTDRNN